MSIRVQWGRYPLGSTIRVSTPRGTAASGTCRGIYGITIGDTFFGIVLGGPHQITRAKQTPKEVRCTPR